MNQYIQELLHWNKAHNLVANNEIHNLDEHLKDSLSLIPYIKEISTQQIIDIGSGGGFPVIPLALWAKENNPQLKFIATDIIEKKIAFLRWCGAKFKLNLEVKNMTQHEIFEEESLIISRAFSSIKNILLWRDKFAPTSSSFCLLKGDSVQQELSDAQITNAELIKNPRGYITIFKHSLNDYV